jgi:hypothetical protein
MPTENWPPASTELPSGSETSQQGPLQDRFESTAQADLEEGFRKGLRTDSRHRVYRADEFQFQTDSSRGIR